MTEIRNVAGITVLPTDADIARVATAIGKPALPGDYTRFLQKYNGGRPTPDTFGFIEQGEPTESTVDYFYSIVDDDTFGLLPNIWDYKDRLLPGFCPIGYDSFGNLILLSLTDLSYGSVWFWDHEREGEEGPTWDNMHRVADSFTQFLENLY